MYTKHVILRNAGIILVIIVTVNTFTNDSDIY